MARVGFLGTGVIAAAMVRGLAGQGHEIRVSDRNAGIAADLARDIPEVSVAPNAEVVAGSDTVILCLMATAAPAILSGLPFRADQRVISVMADVPVAQVRALVAPATDVSLFIPLPSIATGGCPLPVHPDTGAVRDLFGARNPVIPCTDETALNAHFGACALSLPIMALLAEGADWLSGLTGDRAGAETYVTAMFAAYFNAMLKDGSGEIDRLIDGLSTPGGLNASVRDAMAAAGAPRALRAGLDKLKPRLGLPG